MLDLIHHMPLKLVLNHILACRHQDFATYMYRVYCNGRHFIHCQIFDRQVFYNFSTFIITLSGAMSYERVINIIYHMMSLLFSGKLHVINYESNRLLI